MGSSWIKRQGVGWLWWAVGKSVTLDRESLGGCEPCRWPPSLMREQGRVEQGGRLVPFVAPACSWPEVLRSPEAASSPWTPSLEDPPTAGLMTPVTQRAVASPRTPRTPSLLPHSPSLLCWEPGAATQDHHQLGGLKQQACILSQLWRPEVQEPGADRAGSFGGSEGGPVPCAHPVPGGRQ